MVIKLKGKFFISLVISLLVLSLGLFCTSYTMAYSWDELVDFATQVNGDSNASVRQRSLASSLLAHQDGWKNYITSKVGNLNSIKGLWVFYNGTPTTPADRVYLYIWTFVPDLNFSASNGDGMSPSSINRANYGLQFINNGFDTIGSVGEAMVRKAGFGLVETSNTLGIYSGWYLQNKYVPTPQNYFTPNHDHIVTQNNIDYNTLLRGFSVNQWKIGETTNFSDLDGFQFYFYDLVANVELGFVEGHRESNLLRGTNCLYFSPPNMYVNSRYIRYNNPYRLDIYKYLDGVETTETYYYLFLPRNAVVNNGVIINYGSGDYTVQDSTNAIIDSQESGDKQIIEALTDDSEVDSILSGEFIASSSGDIKNYAEKFGFTVLDNPFTTFLLHLLDETFDALTEPSNVILQADYKGLHFELNSDDFITPSSPLKDFVRNLLIFLYIYGNYRFFNHLIVLIQTAKIDKAIATLGTDEFYDSDIM